MQIFITTCISVWGWSFLRAPFLNDVELRQQGVIRIYDVLFDYDVLLDTDAFVRQVIQEAEFQRPMGTDEFHYLLGSLRQRA